MAIKLGAINALTETEPSELFKECYKGSCDPVWGTEKRSVPACSLSCKCFEIGMAHEVERTVRVYDHLTIALDIICDLRGVPGTGDNINAALSEIHTRWLSDLEDTQRR